MIKTADKTFWRQRFAFYVALVLCVGIGTTQALAAAPYVPVYTINNNVSFIDPAGVVTGGANDIVFTWDGTLKTSVAVSGQSANATIGPSAKCLTGSGGAPWKAHDVAVYGPGAYTVYASCAAKAPGCSGGTNPITFNVGVGEIGVHLLVDWGPANRNIDVVNVWIPGVFGPSPMWTGDCGSNAKDTIWDLMSKDPGTRINGYAMVDGPYVGTHWNFNLMGAPVNRVVDAGNNNLSVVNETGAVTGGTNDVRFTWDGTKKTSVAASGQVSNATISSACPFFNQHWWAHDAAIYSAGTYTVYTDCPPGDPGCGTGAPITFTAGAKEIGVHMLVDWGPLAANKNIDVVNVWKPKSEFGPSPIWTGACGSNPAKMVWDLMSKNTGTGINGYAMLEGPFQGVRWNFNIMGVPMNMVADIGSKKTTAPDGTSAVTSGTATKPRRGR